jgi:serine/threonine protein kinase
MGICQSVSYNVDLRDYLPEWVTFGFSAATGNASTMHSIQTWSFSSTLEDTVAKPTVASSTKRNPAPNRSKNKTLRLAVGLGGGGSFLLGGFALILFGFWKRNKRDTEEDLAFDRCMDDEFQRETGPNKFSFNELAHATNNFNDEEKLGQGGFGGVYKGFLRESNSFVAVKRVSKGSKQGMKEYASEVKIISKLRHRNLVQLIGWCHERGELLLVYEFMPNGSLDSHLFTEESLLIWAIRYKVAQGLASALLYLQEEWEQCVVHRDIKSSNIMLDSDFNTKLGDFGLARLVDHVKGSQTTVLAGTMGYMAPEYVTTGKASKESDVYSFGIVALEIACGRKPIKINALEDQVVMVEWVRKLYGIGKVLEAADPRLGGDFDEPQMERLMIVGLWCSHPNRNLRPSVREAIHVLNFEAPLPILPSNMPGTTHLAPVVNRPASMSLSMSINIASDYGGR